MTSSSSSGLARFNALAHDEVADVLHEICSSDAWVAALLASHPYATAADLLAEGDAATAALSGKSSPRPWPVIRRSGDPSQAIPCPRGNSGGWRTRPTPSGPRCSN